MRIFVYRAVEGERKVTIVAGRNARLAPVSVRGTERAAVLQEVAEVVAVVDQREREALDVSPRI